MYITDLEWYSVHCSPILHFDGREVFLAYVSFMGEDRIGRWCGIQFPEKHLTYCRNFSEADIELIIDYLSAKEDNLWEEAHSLPPREEWELDDIKDDLI